MGKYQNEKAVCMVIVVSSDTIVMKDWDSDGVHLMIVQNEKNEIVFVSWNVVRFMKELYESEQE